MIDKNQVNRHLIVRKVDEKTSLQEVTVTRLVDEEVLYHALGTSIFESLKLKNILFEGWKDKKLFTVAIGHKNPKSKQWSILFRDFGVCHVQGAKDFRNIYPLLELANRQYLIVSDSDSPALEAQKIFKANKATGRWMTYSEFVPKCNVETSEDFIKPSTFFKTILQLQNSYAELNGFPEAALSQSKGILNAIRKWLGSGGCEKDRQNTICTTIKDAVFENLEHSDIGDNYLLFLKALLAELNKLPIDPS